jgi:2-polyprenyl-6-methoxyphenol hydroxylase-like FAD-dependent oxidoreductase
MSTSYEVIVAGAGPVGLFLACELATAGVSVLVLEKEADAASPWKVGLHGTRGLHVHSVEAFYRRGLLAKVIKEMEAPGHVAAIPGFDLNFAAHFATINLDAQNLDHTRWKYHIPLPAPFYPAPSSMKAIEDALSQRAEEFGVKILRGTGVTNAVEQGDAVNVSAGNQSFKAQYLVGCDGERSTVREVCGFDFPGTPAEFRGYVVHCDLANPEVLVKGFCKKKNGMYIFPAPGHLYVADFETLNTFDDDNSKPITVELFQSVLRRISETDIVVEKMHMAWTMTNSLSQVTQYRRGRVLLAGDSARIHPSFGAQGLNAGLGDALNLGWKLAATVKGYAAADLLDTYHGERFPEGERVLQWARSQLSLLRPNPYSEATAGIMRDLIATKQGNTYFTERILGLTKVYDLGDKHDIIGYSAPDVEFEDGQRLSTKMRPGRFLLVDFSNNEGVAEYIQSLDPTLKYSGSASKTDFGLKMLLVRPDGVVAWATAEDTDLSEVKSALSRYLSLPELEAPVIVAQVAALGVEGNTFADKSQFAVTATPLGSMAEA